MAYRSAKIDLRFPRKSRFYLAFLIASQVRRALKTTTTCLKYHSNPTQFSKPSGQFAEFFETIGKTVHFDCVLVQKRANLVDLEKC